MLYADTRDNLKYIYKNIVVRNGIRKYVARNSVIFPCVERMDLLSHVLESSSKLRKGMLNNSVKHGIKNIKKASRKRETNALRLTGKGFIRSK